jgi:hypothetical protein
MFQKIGFFVTTAVRTSKSHKPVEHLKGRTVSEVDI